MLSNLCPRSPAAVRLPLPSKASGTTEPLGRIHEIFGPCHTPHYTVKVEGAANKQGMVARFQTAKKQLVKAEKVAVWGVTGVGAGGERAGGFNGFP